jgi:curli biogenesis system outer membrane secretion channel CsgG
MIHFRYIGFHLIIFMIVLLISGCALFQSGKTESWFQSNSVKIIAVLDFEQEGFVRGGKLGSFAADELTSALFIKKQINVVDRAQVKAKIMEKGFHPHVMDNKTIQELGGILNADCLILGKITEMVGLDIGLEEKQKQQIQITFRLISTSSGEIVGMVSHEVTKRGESRQIVRKMLHNMAKRVKL